MTRRAASLALALLVGASACRDKPETSASASLDASPPPTPAASASAAVDAGEPEYEEGFLPDPDEPPPPPALDRGPAAPGSAASREDREKAVLALLYGSPDAPRLAVRATDDGKQVDPGMRDRVWPRRRRYAVRPRPPQVRSLPVSVVSSARLPVEVVSRIVRQSFGRLRLCYENALREKPGIAGRVTVSFVIGRDGQVSDARDGGSDIASPALVSCFVRQFRSLSFPGPEGGTVKVVFPISLTPGG